MGVHAADLRDHVDANGLVNHGRAVGDHVDANGLVNHGRAVGDCTYNGKNYADQKYSLFRGCFEFQCVNGKWKPLNTVESSCDCCVMQNDPHILSFDGKKTDFHRICQYSAVQQYVTFPTVPGTGTFYVLTTFKICPKPHLKGTCLDKTLVKFGRAEVEFTHIDPVGIKFIKGNVLRATSSKGLSTTQSAISSDPNFPFEDVLFFKSDRNGVICVGAHSKYLSVLVCPKSLEIYVKFASSFIAGLCGDYNLDEKDDCRNPDGVEEMDSILFGLSWQVDRKNCTPKQNRKALTNLEATDDFNEKNCPKYLEYRTRCIETVDASGRSLGKIHREFLIDGCIGDLCMMAIDSRSEHETKAGEKLWLENTHDNTVVLDFQAEIEKKNRELEMKNTIKTSWRLDSQI